MLSLLHSDNVIGRGKIGFRDRFRKSLAAFRIDAARLEVDDRVLRNGSIVAAIEGQAARVGRPGESTLGGLRS